MEMKKSPISKSDDEINMGIKDVDFGDPIGDLKEIKISLRDWK